MVIKKPRFGGAFIGEDNACVAPGYTALSYGIIASRRRKIASNRSDSSGRGSPALLTGRPSLSVSGGADVQQLLVMRDVVCGHPSCREAFLEPFAHAAAIEIP